jgi:hypothetical protein
VCAVCRTAAQVRALQEPYGLGRYGRAELQAAPEAAVPPELRLSRPAWNGAGGSTPVCAFTGAGYCAHVVHALLCSVYLICIATIPCILHTLFHLAFTRPYAPSRVGATAHMHGMCMWSMSRTYWEAGRVCSPYAHIHTRTRSLRHTCTRATQGCLPARHEGCGCDLAWPWPGGGPAAAQRTFFTVACVIACIIA